MNAPRLLKSVGLVPDGPVVWGRPIRSRRPGVYVVELPEPMSRMPADHAALRRWLDRVPTLALDGARPTPHELARRLGAFWILDQTVVYVGRSTASLGGRVAAFYATPLGDPRPHAGGHWLKTLTVLDQLRIWWSETDAPEEYEDALLTAFGADVSDEARAALHDATVVLPFANLATATGSRKAHGLTGSTLPVAAGTDAAEAGSRRPVTSGAQTRERTRSTPPARGAAGVLDARAAQPRARAKRITAARPAGEPARLTRARLEKLRAELKHLTEVKRPEVIARVKSARELGDLRENADYEAARNEQSFLEGRIQSLESLLRTAVELEEAETGSAEEVRIGSTVVVESAGTTSTWRIVAPTEASPGDGRISYMSPIGQALIGRRPGDEVTVMAPAGAIAYRVVEVR